tara:strand:+ start:493 stop:630 length:138 start_codon:yes stop_codon:yes gene_type:complete
VLETGDRATTPKVIPGSDAKNTRNATKHNQHIDGGQTVLSWHLFK